MDFCSKDMTWLVTLTTVLHYRATCDNHLKCNFYAILQKVNQ